MNKSNNNHKYTPSSKKERKESWILRSSEKHKHKYNYDFVEYINNKTPVIIICPEHGEFKQRPDSHLIGKGCSKCQGRGKTNEEVLVKLNEIHSNKYEYPNFRYNGYNSKIKIICPTHGEFELEYRTHHQGSGCKKCNSKYRDEEILLNKFNNIHNNNYIYSDLKKFRNSDKIKIICPEHGEFEQSIKNHLIGRGCHKCGGFRYINGELTNKKTLGEFIKKSNKIHSNNYDYSNSKYIGYSKEINIICPEHGEFKQIAGHHLSGSGCPKCSNFSKGEFKIEKYLTENNIEYKTQFKIGGKYFLDFYLEQLNIAIEYDGIQHFEPVNHFGGESGFKLTTKRDSIKNKLCNENNINLIRIPYSDYKNIEDILKEKIPA